MTDDDLRELHRKISAIREKDGELPDHYFVCVVISDLSSIPFPAVFDACAEL